jgi:hypothetical protein
MRYFLLGLLIVLMACGQQEPTADKVVVQKKQQLPEAKPMAMMMRAIYEQSRDMRSKVVEGESLDSAFYRFMAFHELEPTDSTVLIEVFYEHNEDFKAAFENLLRSSNKETYNAMLTQCVSCHEDFCPGPIKRINKLRIEAS